MGTGHTVANDPRTVAHVNQQGTMFQTTHNLPQIGAPCGDEVFKHTSQRGIRFLRQHKRTEGRKGPWSVLQAGLCLLAYTVSEPPFCRELKGLLGEKLAVSLYRGRRRGSLRRREMFLQP